MQESTYSGTMGSGFESRECTNKEKAPHLRKRGWGAFFVFGVDVASDLHAPHEALVAGEAYAGCRVRGRAGNLAAGLGRPGIGSSSWMGRSPIGSSSSSLIERCPSSSGGVSGSIKRPYRERCPVLMPDTRGLHGGMQQPFS
ncbi:hypothetical protein ABIB51_001633 [Arthrobacter sp. UYCu712]